MRRQSCIPGNPAGTVEIAAASLAAVHRINGLPSPTKSSVAVADLLASIKKNGIVSTRAKKLVDNERTRASTGARAGAMDAERSAR